MCLCILQKRGNVIKVDRHKYVKLAYHGFNKLSRDERDQQVRGGEVEEGGRGGAGKSKGMGGGKRGGREVGRMEGKGVGKGGRKRGRRGRGGERVDGEGGEGGWVEEGRDERWGGGRRGGET